MSRNRFLQLAGGLVLLAAVAHVVFSVAVGMTLQAAYSRRIFDVRRWPGGLTSAAVAEMVSTFLAGRASGAAHEGTIFYGSSFAYGYPWQENVVLSYRYASLRPGEMVLNASVVGASLSLLDNGVLCGARNAAIRSRTAIVELPVINSAAAIVSERVQKSAPNRPCDLSIGRRSYAAFAVRHPLGLGWAPFIWDAEAYPKVDEVLVLNKVPAGYFIAAGQFKEIESEYRAQIAAVAGAAQAVADRVFMFPSPVFLTGASELGEDADNIRTQLNVALDECRSAGGVVCLDPQEFYTRRDVFYNMTHLNQRGHQALAEWLASKIAP